MDSLLRPLCDLRRIVKIGEGTYGEAFKGGSLVFKVIPMEGDTWINEAAQKRAGDMMGEAVIALTLSGLRKGERLGLRVWVGVFGVPGVLWRTW